MPRASNTQPTGSQGHEFWKKCVRERKDYGFVCQALAEYEASNFPKSAESHGGLTPVL
jgi:hypothetical protein